MYVISNGYDIEICCMNYHMWPLMVTIFSYVLYIFLWLSYMISEIAATNYEYDNNSFSIKREKVHDYQVEILWNEKEYK